MAPEMIDNKEYEFEVDIWSVGIIAYILLTGDAPFKGNSRAEIQNEIKTKQITYNHAE